MPFLTLIFNYKVIRPKVNGKCTSTNTKYCLQVIGQVISQMIKNSIANPHGKRMKYSREHQVMRFLSVKILCCLYLVMA